MESLSRPLKLSNATTKDPYDGGATTMDDNDYREIFSTSQAAASSIPVLDLSTLGERSDVLKLNNLSSKPDYSNIFGFHDHAVVCYQQLFAWPPSSTTTTSHDSDVLKQFSMSYNNISQKSKDGTKHVTQLHHVSAHSSKEGEFVSQDQKIKTFDIDFKIHPSTVSSPSINVVNHKSYPKRSTTINSESSNIDTSSTCFDVELNVNSVASASASAAALRKAIENAQESIRIAKESVGRKKKGLQNFSYKKSKDSSKVEGRTEDVTATTSSRVFADFMDGEKLFVAKKVIDNMNGKISESNKFKDNTIVYNSTRVTDETESSEPVDTEKSSSEATDFVHEDQTSNVFVDNYEGKIKELQTTACVLEHHSVEELEPVERIEVDMLRESKEITNEVRLSNAHELVHQAKNLTVAQEVEDEEKVSQESNQCDNKTRLRTLENEKQEEVLEEEEAENAETIESDKGIEDASESVESENESKDDRNTEIHKEEETSEMFNDVCELETKESVQVCDNSIEESEVTMQDDCVIKQEENHTVESKGENVDETYDHKFEKSSCDDDLMEDTDNIDGIHLARNIDLKDNDAETTQEVDDVTVASVSGEFEVENAEAMERADASEEDIEEFSEKTSIDQSDNEDEYEVKSEENDVQSESSYGTIDGEKLEVYKSNIEKNIIDNLADLGSENDVRSESSSSSAKTVEEESNIQLPHNEIPGIKCTNEIKDSQEPQYRDKEDDIGEPGPSKVRGKEHFREREHEKNRLAVNRAIREARERAFVEARERAERERAAVEKATEEVRQRMMADAREKVAKASAATKSSSERTSAQSKLRTERAAVERATSEARQRALEKAMSQKSVSDLNSSESALRSKAKLEKHNRIMERAAKALAEKEKRDLLAQKEQAERNRLAENLDANIKRWSNGKKGNLRALLSTLQYILGPESGWQAVSLTEIITSDAVKKAYRKATLCVHPDKLQQRGATIQHKYICEKVFDLLKAAWNGFNSVER